MLAILRSLSHTIGTAANCLDQVGDREATTTRAGLGNVQSQPT